jgi:hypothetical protein
MLGRLYKIPLGFLISNFTPDFRMGKSGLEIGLNKNLNASKATRSAGKIPMQLLLNGKI